MKIEKTQVFGFEASLRGMRNPLDSWDKSDSFTCELGRDRIYEDEGVYNLNHEKFVLGFKDKALAQKLTKAGSEHCKFLRQIQVWVDLTLPRYIWSEFDTYKFNSKNSCSTMHTAHKRHLTQDDFEEPTLPELLDHLNKLISDKKSGDITSDTFIHKFKNDLPEGFLQKRTVNTNYAELLNMHFQREFHRLRGWHTIDEWILGLPYFKDLTGVE